MASDLARLCSSVQAGALAVATATLLSACGAKKPPEIIQAEKLIPERVDYNWHVRPILADRCFACHGPQSDAKGGVRLDSAKNAYAEIKGSGGKHAIKPGSLAGSEVFHRITTADPEMRMPPKESHLTLTAQEKAIITRWIEQGAEYKPHWALIAPTKPTLPKLTTKAPARNPIDGFVRAKLEDEALKPARPADREALIRRVTFDLTGLPPTLAQIDAFVADRSPNAYEKLVNRLLASPAYGERMATYWLDVARYADSDGYLDDKHRVLHPWRDWVIKAFNANLPYDKFVTWQLAGDLLPKPSQEQVLATAFNRLHKRNSEGGIDYEEFRVANVMDRTATFGKAFLGLSVECAQCHDHKYDPITQKNYYELFAFFNSTAEFGTAVFGPDQVPGPSLLLTDAATEAKLVKATAQVNAFERGLRAAVAKAPVPTAVPAGLLPRLSRDISDALVAYYPFDRFTPAGDGKMSSANALDRKTPALAMEPAALDGVKGKAFRVTDYNRLQLGEKVGWFERTEPFSVDLWLRPAKRYDEASVFMHAEDRRVGLKGYSLHLDDNKLKFTMAYSWPSNAIEVTTLGALPEKRWSRVTVTYDGSSKANGVRIYVNGRPQKLSVEQDHLYKSILYVRDIHTYGFNGFTFGHRDKEVPMKDGGIDEVRIFDRDLTALEVAHLTGNGIASQAQPAEQLRFDANQQRAIAAYLKANDPNVASLKQRLKGARDELNGLITNVSEIMVMGDLPKPRPTYLLERGQFDAHGVRVHPDTPKAVLAFDPKLPRNRLGLAEWLFDPKHPLTSRVMVNRLWQIHFGRGLVATSDDFGNQGELPSHPELLDWLATTFVESGWNIKRMQKLIVMSDTYRQSSAISPALHERDPDNKLLARGPRFRLPAEMIRDNALAISGLLAHKVGGPSQYPYQPDGLWDEINNKPWRYKYPEETGEGLYRRSLYTFWKRSSPPPSMTLFDAAGRDVCTVRRRQTSTPLQALVLLNDPQYVEAARVLAERLTREQPASAQRLVTAFRLATGRAPNAKEAGALNRYYQTEYERFSDKPADARAFLSVGRKPIDRRTDPVETAALTAVINTVMNTGEAYSIR